jgi:uncharacterized protein YjbI with pentapeptide repeats
MLLLVKPQFWLSTDVINTLSSMKEVIAQDEDKIHDAIIAEFKKHYPEAEYTIDRLEHSEYYTITTEKSFDEVFSTFKTYYSIEPNWSLILRTAQGERNIRVDSLIFSNFAYRYHENEYISDFELYRLDDNNIIRDLNRRGHNLSEYILNGLNLTTTIYNGSTFSRSNLTGATFKRAELVSTGFYEATLDDADLTNADIRSSIFINASAINTNFSFANARFSNFTGANLTGADLTGADFRHANLTGAILTNCIINNDTRFYGADLSHAEYVFERDNINEIEYFDDEEYEEYLTEQHKDDATYSIEDKLAGIADKAQQPVNAAITIEEKTLSPLVIDPKLNIVDRIGNNYTFEDIVNLLTPKINNVKIPLSHIEINKWYGIASIGNTSAAIWKEVGVDGEPRIGTVFKCKTTPLHEDDEAIVYETVPACMAVHQLSQALNNDKIFGTFLDIVGTDVLEHEYEHITHRVVDEVGKLEISAMLLYKFIVYILTFHTSDDSEESWTHIYDDTEKLKKVVKHAVFNNEEGIMYHPRFDYRMQKSHPQDILLLIMFLESLPYQVQVAWAQNYIKEFIEGYGQSLETFDRTIRSDMGFIASCLNGNLEKFLLSIRTAIIQFYPLELEEETEEDKQNLLKIAVTESEFQKYFGSIQDDTSPTLEGYKIYIQTSASLSEERRNKFLTLLEDPEIVKKIEETISISSGGKKLKRIKRRRTNRYMKSRKHKKTIKKRMTRKNKKTIKKCILKKRILCKNKKTIKK